MIIKSFEYQKILKQQENEFKFPKKSDKAIDTYMLKKLDKDDRNMYREIAPKIHDSSTIIRDDDDEKHNGPKPKAQTKAQPKTQPISKLEDSYSYDSSKNKGLPGTDINSILDKLSRFDPKSGNNDKIVGSKKSGNNIDLATKLGELGGGVSSAYNQGNDYYSKNKEKVKRYLANFELVMQRCAEVEEKDHIRNWQPPITGEIIMETFGLAPSREVGTIKDALKDAMLDGVIPNDFESAWQFMLQKGKEMGLSAVKS